MLPPVVLVRLRVHLPLSLSEVLNLVLKSFCGAVAISYKKRHTLAARASWLIVRLLHRPNKADKEASLSDVLVLR